MQQELHGLQQAMELAKIAPNGAKPVDVESTLSTRGLMRRKLYLMKMMLRNEKQANEIMKEKL